MDAPKPIAQTAPVTTAGPDGLELGVLGPVVAFRGGEPLPLGGPRLRQVLALLLIEPGRPVPVGRLIDELWHGDPPASAETSLRASVSKLRSALGTDALTRSPAGYTLAVRPDYAPALAGKGFQKLSIHRPGTS